VRNFSIPRWLRIAAAALLVTVIVVVLVHPYYDVSNATVGERMLVALVVAALSGAAVGFILMQAGPLFLPQPKPLPIVERNCIRRI
jgi:flagellar biosynthesis protein FliR